MDISLFWSFLAVILVLIGLAGTILPALPGLPLLFAGLWLAAWADGYQHVSGATLGWLAGLAALGMAMDALAGWLGARAYGASKQALWGSLIGGVVGLLFGLPGLLLGPLLGAVAGEWLARRDAWRAGQVGMATLVGLALGMLAKIGCALAMLLGFAWAWWT
ncbi:DUF456 domain-containing protein [Rivihabitans pingtungensis]|uniref:DUF456 domain-containing protein n=1 Tax=Rivihabitans pingtungensis TaxID=1054498 RepID=UPI0023578698|nr:DUF456 family protein [Rivihabitans pingtungensis]MCK6437573.1 DUF456 family protein [Rivihabitans pingtungensis]